MGFAFEGDDLQPEIESGSTDQKLEFWPKVDGKNVSASTTTGDNQIALYDPNDAVLVAAANASPTLVGSVSKFVVTVNATPTSTWTKREGYEARFTWRVTGETEVRTNEVEFAIVARRWPDPISLNDLQSRCHWAGELAQAVADALALSTPEDAARNSIYEAKRDLDARLRARAEADGQLRPTLVYDQRALRRAWTLQALANLMLGAARSGAEDDGVHRLAIEWRRLADSAWSELGAIRYDADQSGLPDRTVRPGVSYWSR